MIEDNYYKRSDFKGKGNIKWTRSDIGKLSAAIRQFNKKLDQVRTTENENYLPSKLDYKSTKEEIFTRSELNRMINSLNRFKKENAEKLYQTQAGEILTKWERLELSYNARRMKQRISNELEKMGISTVKSGMLGNERVSNLQAQLQSLGDIETATGKQFETLKYRLQTQGRSDVDYYRALIFKENYYKMLEGYENFENYDKFKAKLDSIKNPLKFYEFLDQNDLTSDIQYMYDIGGKGVSKISSEEKFDTLLRELDIIE